MFVNNLNFSQTVIENNQAWNTQVIWTAFMMLFFAAWQHIFPFPFTRMSDGRFYFWLNFLQHHPLCFCWDTQYTYFGRNFEWIDSQVIITAWVRVWRNTVMCPSVAESLQVLIWVFLDSHILPAPLRFNWQQTPPGIDHKEWHHILSAYPISGRCWCIKLKNVEQGWSEPSIISDSPTHTHASEAILARISYRCDGFHTKIMIFALLKTYMNLLTLLDRVWRIFT